MNTLSIVDWVIKTINSAFDFAILWGGLVVVLGYPFYYLVKKFIKEKKNISLELFPQTLILLITSFVIGLLWILPELIIYMWPAITQIWPSMLNWFPVIIRLGELFLLLLIFAYIFGHEFGERRWLHSSIGHIAIIFFGFMIGHWTGILFISTPTLVAYYSILYRLAIILLPASNPEDRAEGWKRFIILVSYTWGIQYPLMVVDKHAWNKIDTRIPGDFARDILPMPGFVWTRSHQVVSITGGIKFKRIDGPGVVFTNYLERPEQVFDLRLQLRTNEINVVSKDGISFIVRVFTAFRMDPETWSKDIYDKLRPANTILRGANKPSYTKGSFPYSNLRVQAALGITSTKATTGNSIVYWDQWAINVVEDQARKVISQKNLDELWRPADDKKFASALDVIAKEIKEHAEFTLQAAGILLVAARVVNFRFPLPKMDSQTDGISQQQLATWGSEWERKSKEVLAEAQAESEYAQQEARVYAEALMLKSIADGLQKTKELDPRLPQYVIAMRFLSTLQDHIQKRSFEGEHNTEQEKKTDEPHRHPRDGDVRHSSRPEKEKH